MKEPKANLIPPRESTDQLCWTTSLSLLGAMKLADLSKKKKKKKSANKRNVFYIILSLAPFRVFEYRTVFALSSSFLSLCSPVLFSFPHPTSLFIPHVVASILAFKSRKSQLNIFRKISELTSESVFVHSAAFTSTLVTSYKYLKYINMKKKEERTKRAKL